MSLPVVYFKHYGADHVHFSCPSCDNPMVASLDAEDWDCKCDKCHTKFRVLDPDEDSD